MIDDRCFIQAILAEPSDQSLRLVYADWLEEQGDVGAEFLRLESELFNRPPRRRRAALRKRLRELLPQIEPGWRAALDRTQIENCKYSYRVVQCPKQWVNLAPRNSERVRFCKECERCVYHCVTVSQAKELVRQGHRVAVDSRVERTQGDLVHRVRVGVIGIRRCEDDDDREALREELRADRQDRRGRRNRRE